MKKYFAYDAHCDDVHFFDTLEEAKQHHIGNCEELYDYFASSDGVAVDYLDYLESCFYGESHGYSTCKRREATEEEREEFDYDFYVEPPVLTESVSEWIPCSERMPELCVTVLTTDGESVGENYLSDIDYDDNGVLVMQWDDFSMGQDVTHWMPLPMPPK